MNKEGSFEFQSAPKKISSGGPIDKVRNKLATSREGRVKKTSELTQPVWTGSDPVLWETMKYVEDDIYACLQMLDDYYRERLDNAQTRCHGLENEIRKLRDSVS